MNMNAAGIELIEHFESLQLVAYRDAVGVATIGYGHTNGVKMTDVITKEQADAFLRSDLAKFIPQVTKLLTRQVSDNAFSALVSFAFNLGVGNLASSTLLKLVNRGEMQQAAAEFLRWDHANGKVLEGLTRRRRAERDLFLS